MFKSVHDSRLIFACTLLLVASIPGSRGQEKQQQDPSQTQSAPNGNGSTPLANPKETNIDSITRLRREQKKRDPITIEVEIPNNLHATTRELPVFNVTLKNVDEEKKSVKMAFKRDVEIVEMWRFEIHDSNGSLLPERRPRPRGHYEYQYQTGDLAYGKDWQSTVAMDEHVKIEKPGEYTVRILYYPTSSAHGDDKDVRNQYCCISNEFKLKVGKAVPNIVEVPAGSRDRAKALVAALSDTGPIRLVRGRYDSSRHIFVDPKSPEGKLHQMGRDAVPGLLDALRNEKLSFHRRGWVLALLYCVTEKHDLDRFSEEDLDPFCHDARGALPEWVLDGARCSEKDRDIEPDLALQRKFTHEWLKLAAECWDFRETKK